MILHCRSQRFTLVDTLVFTPPMNKILCLIELPKIFSKTRSKLIAKFCHIQSVSHISQNLITPHEAKVIYSTPPIIVLLSNTNIKVLFTGMLVQVKNKKVSFQNNVIICCEIKPSVIILVIFRSRISFCERMIANF